MEQNVNFSNLDLYQETLSYEKANSKIQYLLKNNSRINAHIKVSKTEISMYASQVDKNDNLSEYILRFGNRPTPEPFQFIPNRHSELPLQGLKVAMDPGHFGGALAKVEARYIDMEPSLKINSREDIQFNEGTLTLLTAKRLRELLEAQGVVVFLTKEALGEGGGVSYKKWREGEFDHLKSMSESQIFRKGYVPYDLKIRAEKINNFDPHLTLIIHFNAGAGNNPNTDQNLGTENNYNMAFVPGSFMDDELETSENRFEFLRLLVTPDLEASIALSEFAVQSFQKHLGVPTVSAIEEIPNKNYLEKNCILLSPGVYARNLTLTRLIHSPLCYGETLCQDNYEECQRLVLQDIVIDGIKTSSRIEQVAQSYFHTILNYYNCHFK
jgi:N-acetylmuramoyl-L-alanine amidase